MTKLPPELQELLERGGYSEFSCREPYRDVLFARSFKDKIGKRYSIHLWGFAPRPELQRPDWTWIADVYVREPFMHFEQHALVLNSPADLEPVEARAEAFWNAMGQPYYSKRSDEGN